jgi:hypothetical protein
MRKKNNNKIVCPRVILWCTPYLVLGGGGQTKVLMKLSVVFLICSGTSSLRERSLRLMNGSEKIQYLYMLTYTALGPQHQTLS